MAHRKAYTAAIMRMPTDDLQRASANRPHFYESFRDAGAVPLWGGGAGGLAVASGTVAVVGGLGASGGTPAQDVECLEAGLRAVGARPGWLGAEVGGGGCWTLAGSEAGAAPGGGE